MSIGVRGGLTAAQKAALDGLGTMASQNANAVAVTGGSVAGITDLAVADGGTGASSASAARTNLGLGTMATQNATAVAVTGGTSGASPTKVIGATFPLTAASVYQSYGIAQPTVQGGSSTLTIADACRFETRTSTTSLGAQAGAFSISPSILSSDVPWVAYFRVRTPASLVNLCAWIGICNAQPTFSSSTPPLQSGLARFVQGVDTKLTAFGRAGGGASAGAAFGPDIATSTTYMVRVRNVPGDAMYFSAYAGTEVGGDFGTEVAVATVPTAGTGLGWVAQGGAYTAGTAVGWSWGLTQLEWR